MAEGSIKVPPFPTLSWDGYAWIGEITLPTWAGFQSRRGAYASVSDGSPSDGAVRLTVDPLDKKAKSPPTPGQIASLEHLLKDERSVTDTILRALVERYPEEKEAYMDAYDEGEVEELPDVSTPEDLKPLIGLSSVHVLAVELDGTAYIGFEFGCEWESEHGAGAMTHRGRVVQIGHADASFLPWVARRDAEARTDAAK